MPPGKVWGRGREPVPHWLEDPSRTCLPGLSQPLLQRHHLPAGRGGPVRAGQLLQGLQGEGGLQGHPHPPWPAPLPRAGALLLPYCDQLAGSTQHWVQACLEGGSGCPQPRACG